MSDIDGLEKMLRSAPLDGLFTRRQYMTRKLLMTYPGSVSMGTAIEAVSSTALSHKDWDMDEERTWAEWETALDHTGEKWNAENSAP